MKNQELFNDCKSLAFQYLKLNGCQRTSMDETLDRLYAEQMSDDDMAGLRSTLRAHVIRLHHEGDPSAIRRIAGSLRVLEADVEALRSRDVIVDVGSVVVGHNALVEDLKQTCFTEEGEPLGKVFDEFAKAGYQIGFDRSKSTLAVETRVGRFVLKI